MNFKFRSNRSPNFIFTLAVALPAISQIVQKCLLLHKFYQLLVIQYNIHLGGSRLRPRKSHCVLTAQAPKRTHAQTSPAASRRRQNILGDNLHLACADTLQYECVHTQCMQLMLSGLYHVYRCEWTFTQCSINFKFPVRCLY